MALVLVELLDHVVVVLVPVLLEMLVDESDQSPQWWTSAVLAE
jgi:hypothetical protein